MVGSGETLGMKVMLVLGRFGIEITKSQQRKDELSGRTKKGKLPVSQYACENYILLVLLPWW